MNTVLKKGEYSLNDEKESSGLNRLRAKLNPESTALIIIDVQKDFCCEGGVFHKRGFDIISAQKLAKRLNSFLKEARKALKHIIHLQMIKKPEFTSPMVMIFTAESTWSDPMTRPLQNPTK